MLRLARYLIQLLVLIAMLAYLVRVLYVAGMSGVAVGIAAASAIVLGTLIVAVIVALVKRKRFEQNTTQE